MAIRTGCIAVALSFALGFADEAHAREALRCRLDVARVRIDGRLAWCAASPRESVISDVVASDAAGAVAFATRIPGLAMRLIVVLVGGDQDLHTMTWDLPLSADDRTPLVTWLGTRRVGFGYSPLVPDVIASWTVRD